MPRPVIESDGLARRLAEASATFGGLLGVEQRSAVVGSTLRPKGCPISLIHPEVAGLPLGYQMGSNYRPSEACRARRRTLARPASL